MIEIGNLCKSFTLHNQGAAVIPVMQDATLNVGAGECVGLIGASGAGKSTLMRMVWGNYLATSGFIRVGGLDVAQAEPRQIIALRRETLGYVSQFLRVIPRVSALDVVAEPLAEDAGDDPAGIEAAREAARQWLTRLRIPERLWHLPPATFSGGEQQRINIARNMIKPKPLLLLDEPTASLDAANTETVIAMIREAVERGAALVGIFHDAQVGAAVATRRVNVGDFRGASA